MYNFCTILNITKYENGTLEKKGNLWHPVFKRFATPVIDYVLIGIDWQGV